jgi:hypothetical protein
MPDEIFDNISKSGDTSELVLSSLVIPLPCVAVSD